MRAFARLSACLALVSLPVLAEPLSTISIPVTLPLFAIRAAVEGAMPNPLVNENGKQTCVEAERLCTDIPEFRGLKIYRRRECIDVTPRIDCNIEQVVVREGDLHVGGTGGTLELQQVFRGQATVSGRGDIGRHIRETATGTARLTLRVTPRVTPDWRIEADVTHQVDWIETPRAKLFNLIDVTFQSRANEALNQKIEAYKRDTLTADLARIAIKDHLAPVWDSVQKPIPVAIPDGEPLYLLFRPQGVALAPLVVDKTVVSTRLALNGEFLLTDRAPPDSPPLPLPDLSLSPAPEGIALKVPVVLGLDRLAALANSSLPRRLVFFKPVRNTLEIRRVVFEEVPGGLLRSQIEVTVSAPGLGPFDVSLSLTGKPVWNAESRILSLRDPQMTSKADGVAAEIVGYLVGTPVARSRLADALSLPLGVQIDRLQADLSGALEQAMGSAFGADAALRLSVADVRIDRGFHLAVRAEGTLSLTVLALD